MSTSDAGCTRTWCPASGSDDAYTPDDRFDTVRCHECGRDLFLTQRLTLPRHLTADASEQP